MNENKLSDISSRDATTDDQKDKEVDLPKDNSQINSQNQHHHSHHNHHHHRGHKSSHHRSSRHNKRTGNKGKVGRKLVDFLKKHRYSCIITVLIFMLAALLITLAFVFDQLNDKEQNVVEKIDLTTTTVEIEFPFFIDEVAIVEKAIVDFVTDEQGTSARDIMKRYGGSSYRYDLGLPVSFEYKIKGIPEGHTITNAVLEISQDSSFIDSQVYELDKKSGIIQVYFLKTGTQYYYRISVSLSNGSQTVSSGEFKTVASPRILSIDGIVNVRDIGGWTTTDGKVIRQGLLYRGSELDGAVESEYCLTEKGLSDMLITLGIKTDMDLRSAETLGSRDALGSGVEHIYYNAPMYMGVFEEANSETMRRIFSDLADPKKYPIYLHCTYGRDRTGSVCYLLEALLGVDEKDLRRDYELTVFYDGYAAFEEFAKLTTCVQLMEGDTIQQKVEGYLLSIGVTADEISSIREILLEE